MAINSLSELHPSGLHYNINVRISRMWEFRGPKDDGEIKHLDLVVVDEKQNAMYVEIPADVIEHVRDKLEEGQVCNIKNFLVLRAKSAYKVVETQYMIKLTRRTVINLVNPEPLSFPKYVYTLTPLAALQNYENKIEKYLDVIGQITAVSNAALVHIGDRQQIKKIIILKDHSENTIELDLLGSRAHEFDDQEVLRVSEEQPVIAIFVGVLMKRYGTRKFLSGSSPCRWYINEDIADIKDFYVSIPAKGPPVERIQLHSEELMQNEIQDKTLLQLKEVCPFKDTGHRFRCNVTITKVLTQEGWYYQACKSCRTRVRLNNFTIKCLNCGSVDSEDRYKISFMGNDNTYELEFVLFGETAQQLIGKSVQRLKELYDKYETPSEISALLGQKYTFVVKISAKRSAQNEDPSFEVLYVVHHFGKQTNMPTFSKNQADNSSGLPVLTSKSPTSSSAQKNLVPLIPIKSKLHHKKENETADIDLMDIEQSQVEFNSQLSSAKRHYHSISDKEQNILGIDDHDDKQNINLNKKAKH